MLPAGMPAVSPSSTQPIASRRDRPRDRARRLRKTSNSSSRVSGRPVTVATPSPTWTTRPICSSRGSSGRAAEPLPALLSPALQLVSERRPSASISVAHRGERALPGEAQDGVREMQFRAGDQVRIDRKCRRAMRSPRTRRSRARHCSAVAGGSARRGHDRQRLAVGKLPRQGIALGLAAARRDVARCARSMPRRAAASALRRAAGAAISAPRSSASRRASAERLLALVRQRLARAVEQAPAHRAPPGPRRAAAASCACAAAALSAASRSAAMPARSASTAASCAFAFASAASRVGILLADLGARASIRRSTGL